MTRLFAALAALSIAAPARGAPPTPPTISELRETCLRPGPLVEPADALRAWLDAHPGTVVLPVVVGPSGADARVAASPATPAARGLPVRLVDGSSSLGVTLTLGRITAPEHRWLVGAWGAPLGLDERDGDAKAVWVRVVGPPLSPDEPARVWHAAAQGRARTMSEAIEGGGRPDDPPRRGAAFAPARPIAPTAALRRWLAQPRADALRVRLPVVLTRDGDAVAARIGDTIDPAPTDAVRLRLVEAPPRTPLGERLLLGPPCGPAARAEWLEGRLAPPGADGVASLVVERWIGPVEAGDRPAAVWVQASAKE